MRRIAPALALLLAGCGPSAPEPQASAKAAAIGCSLQGAPDFRLACTAEKAGGQLLIHHPDGGFRRLTVVPGGFETADGALRAMSDVAGGVVELAIGEDRYRIPLALRREPKGE
jgi:hypothetical protein